MDRNTITVMSGQIVDFFDQDFRELYAASEQVDLYKEFNITKPPVPVPTPKLKMEPIRPLPVSASRFQVSLDNSRPIDLKVPAHKYHNPKYSLVFGNSRGFTGSLQDLSTTTDSLIEGTFQRKGLQSNVLLSNGGDKANQVSLGSPTAEEDNEDGKGSLKKNQPAPVKKRSSFRHFLKGKGGNHITETIEEGVVAPQRPAAPMRAPETNGVGGSELDDTFEIIEKPAPLKTKIRKPAKVIPRSVSLQTLNMGDEDGT